MAKNRLRDTTKKELAFDFKVRSHSSYIVRANTPDDNVTKQDSLEAGENIYIMAICLGDNDGLGYIANNLTSPAIAIASQEVDITTPSNFGLKFSGGIRIPGATFTSNHPVWLTTPNLVSTPVIPNLTTEVISISSGEYLQRIGHSFSTPIGMTTEYMYIDIEEPMMRE